MVLILSSFISIQIIFVTCYPRLVAKVEVKPQAPVADLERREVLNPPGHHGDGDGAGDCSHP